MRKDFGARALTYPQPVYMIGSFDKNDHPDLMNAAWGGISDTMEISLSLSSGHKTVQNILKTQAFTVSIADEDHVVECDYVGVVSGHKEPNKLEKAGFTFDTSTLPVSSKTRSSTDTLTISPFIISVSKS